MQKIKCSFDIKGFFDSAKQVFPLHEKSSVYAKINYKNNISSFKVVARELRKEIDFEKEKEEFSLHLSELLDEINKKYDEVLRKIEEEKEKIKPKKIKKKKYLTWSYLFLKSDEWKLVRQEFLSESEKICVYCGATEQLQVDHILPKSKYKHLALDKSNLQILCWPCNKMKGAKDPSTNK